MVDITDLYSTVSRTRVSPQKSYVASYTITSSLADSGSTLSVANGQYYCLLWGYTTGGSETITVKLLQGATTEYTWSFVVSSNSNISWFTSPIFQNTSGSTQTIKVQALGSVGGITLMKGIQLLSGTIIQATNKNGKSTFPLKCYINNLEFVGSCNAIALPYGLYYGFGGGQDLSTTTTILLSNINIAVDYFEFQHDLTSYTNSATTLPIPLGFIAFDFDGKTLAL